MQRTSPRRWLRAAIPATVVVLACMLAACGGSSSSNSGGGRSAGPVTITVWHGQSAGPGTDKLMALVAEFNRTHPGITVNASPGSTGTESILQKVTAALAGGDPPNVAYSFGSNVANISRSPQVVDLTNTVKGAGWGWNGYYPAYRDGVTINGKVVAVPGPGDSLAIIYNKRLFRRAGVPEPRAGWTWDDYRALAKRLTDKGAGVYGAAFQSGGSLDSTWPFWPMVWQRGGEVLSADGKSVGWNDQSGLGGLQFLRGLAQDGSVYADTSPGYPKMLNLFNNGSVAMYEGDPWQLPTIKAARIDYGVAPLPSANGNGTTIVGPDAWFVFRHSAAQDRAAAEFLQWLTAPRQDAEWNAATGNLPSRAASTAQPAWQAYAKATPGLSVFTDGLGSGKVVPRVASYSAISDALGEAIQSAVIKTTGNLEDALHAAADKANSAIATTP